MLTNFYTKHCIKYRTHFKFQIQKLISDYKNNSTDRTLIIKLHLFRTLTYKHKFWKLLIFYSNRWVLFELNLFQDDTKLI